MAVSNRDRVGKALDLLQAGLAPYVEREMQARHGADWRGKVSATFPSGRTPSTLDVQALLSIMRECWPDVFSRKLGNEERTLVHELREVRNRWAHQQAFSFDDAYRALDSVARLLTAVAAEEAAIVEREKHELLRLRYEEQRQQQLRRAAAVATEGQPLAGLPPWREVVTPHPDVASGRYQEAEFAADLAQVVRGEGAAEYRDPVEFFRRTFLTDGLRQLLVDAVRRLAGTGGDPVVQLQTNFGGGKTHSMLALYHLFSGTPPRALLGVADVLRDAGVDQLPHVRRVVLVGNRISPGNPVVKPDGTVVRTLWGELAWQLGGPAAFARVQADDERATSPGDVLRELMNAYGPCLLLIDEWVAYARQLHDAPDLPGGSFETHFTFAQALTESASAARQCLLVVSLPASDSAASPHAVAEDVEVGGERGRAALERLRNVVGRVEASWRPASAEEGFEIVRRRLFEPLVEREQYTARDGVARAFYDHYRTQAQEFPSDCRDASYEKRLRDAYPIHPELFDRLYTDWSTLVKFQRTRGVLRLMAAVIHSLWERGDRNPLIMPASVPIDDPRVQTELTRYLPDNWVPVIEKDVDGPSALPHRLDEEVPNLGRFQAARRVARTIYLGSAPTATAANRGVEDRQIKLGCVMPGESPAVFGDALRRLGTAATYLYQDGARYWYSIQPTVTKLAEDRAEQLQREPDKVAEEIGKRLRANLRDKGDFAAVHPLPHSGHDVPDDLDARLVVLGPEYPYSREPGNKAETAARTIWESRGSAPRLYRNTLVFLAVDQARLQDLDEAVRRYLAWDWIVNGRGTDDLTAQQVRQAETQKKAADDAIVARLPEAYQWLLVPVQPSPQGALEWKAFRLLGSEALAVRASKKLRHDELLITAMAGTRLKMELDKIPLWRGDYVEIKQLADDFARYVYLPRLRDPAVLVGAIRDGLGLLLWRQDSFAYADSYDAATGRYVGLRAGRLDVLAGNNLTGLLVRPDVAGEQLDRESAPPPSPGGDGPEPRPPGGQGPEPRPAGDDHGDGRGAPTPNPRPAPAAPKRFHGAVALNPIRVGSDAGRVAEEVIAHLAGLVGADVTVTLEIEAHIPAGAPDNVVRTVTENARALKFGTQGFEPE